MLQMTLTRRVLLLKRHPTDIWTNAFAKKVPPLWYANTDTQFLLDAYAATSYCSSYMTKQDTTTSLAFCQLHRQSTSTYNDKTQFIRKLGNALLNYQQMYIRQAIHIALSLPPRKSSQRTVFINTAPFESRVFMLKSLKLLAKEDDNSENIMYASVIDKYIARPQALDDFSLAEYTSLYYNKGNKIQKRRKPQIIRFVKYNRYIDYENYCREKLMLYVPFRIRENTLLSSHNTWAQAFNSRKIKIENTEKMYNAQTDKSWGDIENAAKDIHTDKN